MGILIFEFYTEYKDFGSIETKVSVYEECVVIDRRICGVFAAEVRIPTTTVIYFEDIADISHVIYKKPSFMSTKTLGWIDFSGNGNGNSATDTVDTEGEATDKTDLNNVLRNQYCVVYNKDSKNIKKSFMRLYDIFTEWKEKNIYTQCI